MRRFSLYCAAMATVATVWIGWLVIHPDADATQLVSNLGLTAIALAAAVTCVRKAGMAAGRARLAWRLFGAACLSWGTGMAIWTWYESLLGREVPFPSAADIGYLGFVPLTVGALLSLPTAPERLASLLRTALDGLLIACSLLLISWVTFLGPVYRAGSGSWASQVISLAYPLGDVVTITILLFAFVRSRRQGLVPGLTLALLSAGLTFFAIADSGFVYLASQGSYASGSLIDGGWFLGFGLLLLASLRPPGAIPISAGEEELEKRSALLVPYVAVVLAVVAAVLKVVQGSYSFLVWNALGLILLVVLRQVLTLLENLSLTRNLEERVRSRTAELHQSEQRFRSLVQNSSDVITLIDRDWVIRYQSASAERVFGYRGTTLVETNLGDLVDPEHAIRLGVILDQVALEPLATRVVEFSILHSDGLWCQTETTVTNMLDDDSVNGLVLNTRDVSERKRLESELLQNALHDSLTHLANRALFKNRLEHALTQRRRHHRPLAVLFLDLDGFKGINDSLGHAYGDLVLVEVAERLLGCVRGADTVARLGGDEFAVLLEEVVGDSEVNAVADRICDALRTSVKFDEREVFVGGSVGIAQAETGQESAEELLRNADLAMYRAKAEHNGAYLWYEPSMHASVVERLQMEADLRRATERGEFFLLYQPIVALETGRITGVEALIRWRHPTRGLVSPTEFIHVAESNGMIVPIGEWALGEACRQLRLWHDAYPDVAPTMSVNLSGRQLQRSDLIEVVLGALEGTGVDPRYLVLEMTESILIDQTEETLANLHVLKDLGVKLAIDDFGTGYSSLSYLHRLPVDIIKIDRSFVERLSPQVNEAGLAASIVRIGQGLGLTTVAEGIEQQHQLDVLKTMGCDRGQGFLFAEPLGPDDLARLLADPTRPLFRTGPLVGTLS